MVEVIAITTDNIKEYETKKDKKPALKPTLKEIPEFKFDGKYPDKIEEKVLTHTEIIHEYCAILNKIGHKTPEGVILFLNMKKGFTIFEDKLCLYKNPDIDDFKIDLLKGLVAWNKITEKDEKNIWFHIFKYHVEKKQEDLCWDNKLKSVDI